MRRAASHTKLDGCFGGGATVTVVGLGAEATCVRDVRAGDEVVVADGTATIRCIAQSTDPSEFFTFPSGLEITGTHPVRIDGEWRRPQDLPEATTTRGLVYNFVLDRCHVLVVDGVECVTLGHGLEGPVVEHAYYGTDQVVHDLQALPGWEDGLVTVGSVLRGPDGHAVGMGTEQAEAREATVPVTLEVKSAAVGSETVVMVRAVVPEALARPAVDLCCVVDVSGSMGTDATYETAGQKRSDGLSILDVVRHAAKTVVKSLSGQDRLSVVAFNHESVLSLELVEMTEAGQAQAESALDALRPAGQTNLWGGLERGLDALREGGLARQKTLLLLTDGRPNVCPPKGHLAELARYRECHPEFACQIGTFGFGYQLDSELLCELAEGGGGTYAFIPDAPMVGTVFVDAIANVLSAHSQRSVLHLTPVGGAVFKGPVLGDYPTSDVSWGRVVELGSLQLGQAREVAVPMVLPDGPGVYLEATLEYGPGMKAVCEAQDRTDHPDVEIAWLRSQAVRVCTQALQYAQNGQMVLSHRKLQTFTRRLESSPSAADPRLVGLKADVEGRVLKALTGKDRFDRWGKHYLRAWRRAHQIMQCTNFVDPGVQGYGGTLFARLRQAGDELFLSLPAPKPAVPTCPLCGQTFTDVDGQVLARHAAGCNGAQQTRRRNTPTARARAPFAPAPTPSVDMNNYYDRYGGCFGSHASVTVVGVGRVRVSDVQAGMEVVVAGGTATVRCVVQSTDPSDFFAFPSGLEITGTHPVRIDGEWRRPQDLPDATTTHGLVYNFVLDRCHVLLVDGVECVTLGHGLEGPVVGHAYYGTDRVLRDLEALPGFADGRVRVGWVVRNAQKHAAGLHCGPIKTEQTLAPAVVA